MMSKDSRPTALRAEWEESAFLSPQASPEVEAFVERLLAALEHCHEVAGRQESEIVRLRAALEQITALTRGYSGSEIASKINRIAREAALEAGP